MAPQSWPAVTVAVLSWQGAHLLPDCLDALRRQDYPGERSVWVVDNGSSDGTAEVLARHHPDVRMVANGANLGFAGGYNAALGRVRTPLVALLNNDARPATGWLTAMVAALQGPGTERVAAVTSKLVLPDGRVNNTGVVVFADGYAADRGLGERDDARYAEPAEVFGFSGGAVLLRTDAVREAGGFDADFFLYYEDTELSWHLRRRGWSVRYEPAEVVHLHAATTGVGSPSFRFHNERNRLLLLGRHATWARATRAHLRYLAGAVRAGDRQERRARLQVMASYLRLLPATLRRRRAVQRAAVVPRREVERWLVPTALRRPDGGLVDADVAARPLG